MNTPDEANSAIDALHRAWRDAFHRQDVDGILDLLAADYILWASGAQPLQRDAVRPRLEAALQMFDIVPSFECEERLVSGDLAFERGWDVQQIRLLAGGDQQTQRQRVFLLLQRGADGRWRFARGMSQPPPAS